MPENKIYIGTSGWSYKHWKGRFYPEGLKEKDHFSYYMERFNTVELNNTFYHLPKKETFTAWKKAVPGDFIYAVKASRYITHLKRLHDPEESTALFFEHALLLGKKLGPVLFQLPPFMKINLELLKHFLKQLSKKYRYVFEFRNESWYTDDVYKLLKKYNCAFCIYELEGHLSPLEITADFIYVRLHGPGAKYSGDYSEKTLKEWAKRCKSWLKTKDVYVYFDNDQDAYAAFNALRLKDLVKKI